MNTREIAVEYRLSHWAQIMEDRSRSGLSIRGYCKSAGIHENVYFYWQRKLREAACEQLSATGFAEVRLATMQAAPVSAPTPAPADVVNPGGLRIEASGVQIMVDSEYPAEKLAILLQALSRP